MSIDYGIDLGEVRRVIDGADVLVVRFSMTDRRLLADLRTNDTDRAIVRVVPPVASGQERFKALRAMRPSFPPPERILTFQWPRHARSLVDAGLWAHFVRRAVAVGGTEMASDCERALQELIEAERQTEIEAILGGEGFKTLWEPAA